MRRFIHILSFLAVALFVLSMASIANANGVDPSIIIFNPNAIGTIDIPGTTFLFYTTTGNSPDCNFVSPSVESGDCLMANTNPGGATWTSMDINISQMVPNAALNVTCSGGPYFTNACTATNNLDNTVNVDLTGGPGVTFGTEIGIEIFGWNTCSGAMGASTVPNGCVTFDGTMTLSSSSVPEPSSFTLLLVGGSAGFLFLAWRKRQDVCPA